MEKLVWHTEQRLVRELVPYGFNPRRRNGAKQIELLKSIADFNIVDTPVLNLDGILISGQRRLEAMFELERADEMIDVRVPNRMLSEDEVKRYCLLANTHAGEWDLPKLEAGFAGIYRDIIDLPAFEADLQSADLLDKQKEKQKELLDDGFTELPNESAEPVARRGDIFELNRHRLFCGDCTEYSSMKTLMNGKLANMVFTDPPYNVRVKEIVGNGKTKHEEFVMASGEMNKSRFTRFLEDVFLNLIKFTSDGSVHYICMDWKHVNELTTAGKIYTEMKNMIVWVKDNGGMGSFYRSKHELIFVYKNGKGKNINNFMLGQTGRYRTNVWEYSGMNSFAGKERELLEDHPTVKPVKLVGDAILDCSGFNNIILDVFLGSGTTLIAAEQTGRICCGMELDEKYVDLIIKRYLRFMKQYGKPVEIKRNGVILTDEELKHWQ
jgi:DNA modification methylase